MKRIFKIYFIFPILLLVFTSYAVDSEMMLGMNKAKEFWFYGTTLLMVLSACVSLLVLRKPTMRLRWPDLLLLLYYGYIVVHIWITDPIIFHLDKFAILTLAVILYFILKSFWSSETNISESSYFKLFSLGLMASASGQAVIGLLQLYGIQASLNTQFQITGTFINPAPFSFFLGAVFPFSLAVYFHTKHQMKANGKSIKKDIFMLSLYYVSIATLLLILLILPITMIRTGWLMALIGSSLVLYREYKTTIHSLWAKRWVKLISIPTVLLVILVASYAVYGLKRDSADGRALIWEITAYKIKSSPFFGSGFGSFSSQYNNWQADWFAAHPEEKDGPKAMLAGNVQFAYNEFLEMAAETGLVGLALFSGFLLLLIIKITKSDSSVDGHLLPLILALLVGSLFSYPLFSLPTHVLLILALSLGTAGLRHERGVVFKLSFPIRIVALVIVLSVCFAFSSTKYKEYQALKEWTRAIYLQSIGSYKEALPIYQRIYQDLKYEGAFLQYYGKCLSLDAQYAKSNEILREATALSSDIFLYTTLGDNYKTLCEYKDAIDSYQKAIDMVPHKFYAPYLLARLHFETGDTATAVLMARYLTEKQIKIHSPAIEEIKQEMNTILITYDSEQTRSRKAKAICYEGGNKGEGGCLTLKNENIKL